MAVTIYAKDEGYIAVTVTDEDRYDAWCRENGIADDAFGIPYYSHPDGQFQFAVNRIADVDDVARFFGVALDEVRWS